LAPFTVALVPLNYDKSEDVRNLADQLYNELKSRGVDVLLDDRKERPGVKFADMELTGIPHRLVISDRGIAAGQLEYKGRRDADSSDIELADAANQLIAKLGQ
jgi:prolyl-tRNA synthetase